jgi:hypothetical protein
VLIEAAYCAKANLSFGILDDRQRLVGIQPLYRRDLSRSWVERILDCGYHRHTGLALRDDLPSSDRQAALRLALRQIFLEADTHDVDRVLLNVQNLAPFALESRTQDIPPWLHEFGFEAGMHMTPHGDLPVPGMSTLFAEQIVHLHHPVDTLFHNLDSACQRAIRKAEQGGLSFCPTGNTIDEYYQLAQISAQRTGEQLLPRSYYEHVWQHFAASGGAALLFVRVDQRPVAALFLLIDKQGASFLAGVSHHDSLALRVNDFLHWQAILWLQQQGVRLYRLGPTFPELPSTWPVSRVSRFKGKFGGISYPVIQGNYFRRPDRYRAEAHQRIEAACEMRLAETEAHRQQELAKNGDPARDLILVLRRYGYLSLEARTRPEQLLANAGIWWSGCSEQLQNSLAEVRWIIHSHGDELARFGLQCRNEPEPAVLSAKRSWRWLGKPRPAYRSLLPHVSFRGPGLEPIWCNPEGRVVLGWWHYKGRKILLTGLNPTEEIIRYSQGDAAQTCQVPDRSRFNFSFERANYLFDSHLVPGHESVPWADHLGFTVVRLLAQLTGAPLVHPLPNGAHGAVLLTGDDDQAPLERYREQMEVVGTFPITYYLLPSTKHTIATLADLPATVELGLHVDALESPDRYEEICADQAARVRQLTGKPVRSIRNHGFLNRGYLGHLRAWEECGLALDLNYAGLDGTALTGSFLPFRVRRADGTWSKHISLLTAFGDGMRYIHKWTEDKACERIRSLAKHIEQRDPGVLVFNMHPENIPDTRKIHQLILSLGRRQGWIALGAESYLSWLEARERVTIKPNNGGWLVGVSTPVNNVGLTVPVPGGWRSIPVPDGPCEIQVSSDREAA